MVASLQEAPEWPLPPELVFSTLIRNDLHNQEDIAEMMEFDSQS